MPTPPLEKPFTCSARKLDVNLLLFSFLTENLDHASSLNVSLPVTPFNRHKESWGKHQATNCFCVDDFPSIELLHKVLSVFNAAWNCCSGSPQPRSRSPPPSLAKAFPLALALAFALGGINTVSCFHGSFEPTASDAPS